MPLPRDLDSLSVEELQSLAHDYQLPKADGLSRSSLLYHLESIREYETQSATSLQELYKERGFTRKSKLKKAELARLHHRYYLLFALTVDELQRRAAALDLPGSKRLPKTQLIVRYLEHELETQAAKPSSGADVETSVQPIGRPIPHPTLEEKPARSRMLGTLLKSSSAFFVLISLAFMLLTPLWLMRTAAPARSVLSRAKVSLRGVDGLLDGLSLALTDSIEAIDSAAESLQSVSQVLDDSEPLIDSSSVLLGTALPDAIRATQDGLLQSEDSARALDQVLRGLAALRPLTGVRYEPEVPLHEGIAGTAEGLDPLPEALVDVRDRLLSATSDLDDLSRSLRSTAADMRKLNTEIQAQEVQLARVKSSIENLSVGLDTLEQNLTRLFWIVGLMVEILFAGIALTQVAVFLVGQTVVEQSGRRHNTGD